MPFATTWMELETLMRSEVSQKDKDQYHTYIWNLIYGQNETLHRKGNHGHGEWTCRCQGVGGGSAMDLELGVNRCKLLPLEWISNEILLYSAGNYILSLMEHDNVRRKNVYMYV